MTSCPTISQRFEFNVTSSPHPARQGHRRRSPLVPDGHPGQAYPARLQAVQTEWIIKGARVPARQLHRNQWLR